jgi:hypothetical protein
MATQVVRLLLQDGDAGLPAFAAFRTELIALVVAYDGVRDAEAADRVDEAPVIPLLEREDTRTAEDELLTFEGRVGDLLVDTLEVSALGRLFRGAKSDTWG